MTNFSNQSNFFNSVKNWWSPKGPMRSLHAITPERLSFILQSQIFKEAQSQSKALSILDIGAGAGLISEPLARKGHDVTACDTANSPLEELRQRASTFDFAIKIVEGNASEINEQFDVVCALDVIEHVEEAAQFIEMCAQRLKPGGTLFLSTLNRNFLSFAGAIVMAEYVTRWVPRGTHEWRKFIKPAELDTLLQACSLKLTDLKGINFSVKKKAWHLSHSCQINYILSAKKC
tara:strand:+ start:660 stop:1358 length:699 start_codon:yes stop_codon:yes gene_type:complete